MACFQLCGTRPFPCFSTWQRPPCTEQDKKILSESGLEGLDRAIDLQPVRQFWDEFKRRASRALSPNIGVRPRLMLSRLNGSKSLAAALQNLVERLEAEERRLLQRQINAHGFWNVIYERVGSLSTYFWTYIIRSQRFEWKSCWRDNEHK